MKQNYKLFMQRNLSRCNAYIRVLLAMKKGFKQIEALQKAWGGLLQFDFRSCKIKLLRWH